MLLVPLPKRLLLHLHRQPIEAKQELAGITPIDHHLAGIATPLKLDTGSRS